MKLKYFYIFTAILLIGGGLWLWFRKKAQAATANINFKKLDIYKPWSLRLPEGNNNDARAEISAFQEYLNQPITGIWNESNESEARKKFGLENVPGFDGYWFLDWLPAEYRREKLINLGITIY